VGGLLPNTELEDQLNLRGSVYVRRALLPHWQVEVNGGYERLNATDSGTDVGMVSGRVLFSPLVHRQWHLYLSGGVGLLRYDWDQPQVSPLRTPGLEGIGAVPMLPLATGLQYVLSDHVALEVAGGYTLALGDGINAVEEGGNDAMWHGTIGLTLGRFGGPSPRRPASVPPVVQMDTAQDKKQVPPPPVEPAAGRAPEEAPVEAEMDEAPALAVSMPPPMRPAKVLFELDSAQLSAPTQQILADVLQALRERPEVALLLRGHTDSSGSVGYNTRLGLKRVQAVKQYLVGHGIAAERLRLDSKGESEPVGSNATAAGRRLNRRVEIMQLP
jgi:outer membrane protein OmpA-like peptidoglycan-associated protein